MDVLGDLAAFASELTFDAIPAGALRCAKERLVDTVGCAIGGLGSAPADIGLSIAPPARSPELGGRVIGSGELLSADSAAFVNTCLIRYLDYNDTFVGLHPSDTIGAILAVAPQVGASGADVVLATVIAYEVSCRIEQSAKLNGRGWDQGFPITVGTALGIARLAGIDQASTRHAASLAAVTGMHMRATRSGQLSMWKGAATAHATRNSVLAVQLAKVGMTGPEDPVGGRDGLEQLVTGPLDLRPFGSAEDDFLIGSIKTKYWPVVYSLQGVVWAARDLASQVSWADLDSIEVSTFHSAWRECASEPAKWDPRTRETADHSLPYILARSLVHGGVDELAFEESAFLDPRIRPLMDKVTVAADDGIVGFPDDITVHLLAHTRDGRTYRASCTNPLGHETNRLSTGQLSDKFRALCSARLPESAVDRALEVWWSLEVHGAGAALATVAVQPRDRGAGG